MFGVVPRLSPLREAQERAQERGYELGPRQYLKHLYHVSAPFDVLQRFPCVGIDIFV